MNKEEFRELMDKSNELVNFPGKIPSVGLVERTDDFYIKIIVDTDTTEVTKEELMSIIYLSLVLNSHVNYNECTVPESIEFIGSVPENIDYRYKDALEYVEYIMNGNCNTGEIEAGEQIMYLRLDRELFNEHITTKDDLCYSIKEAVGGSFLDDINEMEKTLMNVLANQIKSLKRRAYDKEIYRTQCETLLGMIDSTRNKIVDKKLKEIDDFIVKKMDRLMSNLKDPEYMTDVLTEITTARYILENSVLSTLNEITNTDRQTVLYRLNNINLILKHVN